MSSDDTRSDDQDDDTPTDLAGPDAHVCNTSSETLFGLNGPCPDCRAPAGVDCDWSCSSNWN